MSFHLSAKDIKLSSSRTGILKAKCRNERGDWVDSEFDIDKYIGNSDGYFEWSGSGSLSCGSNLTKSARSLRLEDRGNDGYWLTAELPKRDGSYRERQGIKLSDGIGNKNGKLVYTR